MTPDAPSPVDPREGHPDVLWTSADREIIGFVYRGDLEINGKRGGAARLIDALLEGGDARVVCAWVGLAPGASALIGAPATDPGRTARYLFQLALPEADARAELSFDSRGVEALTWSKGGQSLDALSFRASLTPTSRERLEAIVG